MKRFYIVAMWLVWWVDRVVWYGWEGWRGAVVDVRKGIGVHRDSVLGVRGREGIGVGRLVHWKVGCERRVSSGALLG